MATSGSADFTRTRDQIIGRSLRLIGAIKAGETPGAQEVTDAAEALNAMVKRWQKKPNLKLWAVSEATLFPQANQVQYALARSGTDHCTASYVQTTLSAAAVLGATTLSVTATTSITAADYIGVVLDDGTLHWSTVSSKTSSTVTIADALADSAASGAVVFTYTTKIERPLKVVDARRYNIVSGFDTPLRMEARLDYRALPNKAQVGQITSVFYDAQLSTGQMYLWQPLTAITDLVKFTWHRPLMDFDAPGDNPDLPQEWLDALAFNLAVSIAAEYDVSADRLQVIATQAASYLDDVAGDDRENESYFFGVDVS